MLVANIYNSYFEEYRQNIDDFIVSKHSDKENPIYYALLEALEIDATDFEFQQLSKQYHIDEIKKLNLDQYLKNPFFSSIDKQNLSLNKYSIKFNTYNPYECFLYEELEIQESAFYKEITKLGYFDKPATYIELFKGNKVISSFNPYEFNCASNSLSKIKGNLLIVGLGLGYLPYLASINEEIISITVVEKDTNLIELFNTFIKNDVAKNKIKIVQEDYLDFIKQSNSSYDYVYFNLSEPSPFTLTQYIKLKSSEDDNLKTTYLYKNEKTLLALLRRYIIVIFEEYLEGFTSKDYEKAQNDEDKIINQIYKNIQKEVLSNRQSIDKLLSDKALKTLVKKINL